MCAINSARGNSIEGGKGRAVNRAGSNYFYTHVYAGAEGTGKRIRDLIGFIELPGGFDWSAGACTRAHTPTIPRLAALLIPGYRII